MKRFRFEFQEICYGVVDVFAEDEDEARELAECEGDRYVNKSEMELGDLQEEEDIEDEYDDEDDNEWD